MKELPVRNHRRPPKRARNAFFGGGDLEKTAKRRGRGRAEAARAEVGAEADAEVGGRRAEAARTEMAAASAAPTACSSGGTIA